MTELVANFTLNNNPLNADFDLSEGVELNALFQIGDAIWGKIAGDINDQLDLKDIIDTLSSQIEGNHSEITNINTTISSYGNIVTHNTSEFATSAQGVLADTALQPGANISELVNNEGYISGITSNDVTTALGYTPYNSTNPNGYTSNVGTVTSVNNTSPDSNGNVTIALPDSASWGYITGTLSNQTDLKNALDLKANSSSLSDYVKLNGGSSQQSITLSSGSGTTALGVTSRASSSYIAFSGTLGFLGSYGVDSTKKPVFYNGSSHTLAYTTDIKDATLTIQKNGTTVNTFTANASSNVTCNITVPTDTNDLTNGAGYITSSAITNMQTTTNLVTSVSSSSTDSQYPSAKLFYDTCGNIEATINAIRGI